MSEKDQPDSPSGSPKERNGGGDEKHKGGSPGSYGLSTTGDIENAIQAEHANITIHHVTNIIGDHHLYTDTRSENTLKNQERYKVGVSDPAFTPNSETKQAVEGMPVSDTELDDWFFKLTNYEQCFVLAMAVFYGAAVHVVVNAAEQLYVPLRELEKEQQKKQEYAPTESVPRTSRTQLLERLHITSRRISGTDRLYWQDTDTNNDSAFSTRLLLYITREASFNFGAHEGQIFKQQLLIWVNSGKSDGGDVAWRAARALGVSWWQNHLDEAGDLVNTWACSKDDFDWHRAAWSLDGAYKIDKMNFEDAADNDRKSPVLKKLRRWVGKARNKQNVSLGSTAAITYAFIGRSSPQVGMRGLDTLLELPRAELDEGQDYEEIETLTEIYNATVFSYRDLALSGRPREILQHLAEYVKSVCYDRVHLNAREKNERYRQEVQRRLRIGAACDTLYWMAETFFINRRELRSVSYRTTGTLPAKPVFENKEGREVLLEGILLVDEKEWRNNISTLLCAALVEKYTKLVFLLLRAWADLVMRDQSIHPDDVRKSYIRFLRDLAIQVDTWCHHLQRMDFAPPPAIATFIRNLESWKNESRGSQKHGYVPINLLAQEVLDELPFKVGGLVPTVQKNEVI